MWGHCIVDGTHVAVPRKSGGLGLYRVRPAKGQLWHSRDDIHQLVERGTICVLLYDVVGLVHIV